MPFAIFGMFLVIFSLFIRGANFAIGEQEVCGEYALPPSSNWVSSASFCDCRAVSYTAPVW